MLSPCSHLILGPSFGPNSWNGTSTFKKILRLSISWPLIRHLGRAKKKGHTGGDHEETVYRFLELQTNRRSDRRRVRTCQFVLEPRWGSARVQPSREDSMGGGRRIAPGDPGGLAMCASVSLLEFRVFAAPIPNC